MQLPTNPAISSLHGNNASNSLEPQIARENEVDDGSFSRAVQNQGSFQIRQRRTDVHENPPPKVLKVRRKKNKPDNDLLLNSASHKSLIKKALRKKESKVVE